MSASARDVILGRIDSSLGDIYTGKFTTVAEEWESLSREYERSIRLSTDAKLELLQDRLRDYDAEVTRVSTGHVAAAISVVLQRRGNLPTLLPEGFPEEWIPDGIEFTADKDLSTRQLDGFDGIVTTATTAIAQTGSLVLTSIPGQGRRAVTLVPDFHLCVVRAEDIVTTVPEAFALLALDPVSPITFISGPSATADIEMTRIKGVHGPRFLHVMLVVE